MVCKANLPQKNLSQFFHLEHTFQTAHNWTNGETGAGLVVKLERDNLNSFSKAAKNRYIYYYNHYLFLKTDHLPVLFQLQQLQWYQQ
jgi:hypothetical protein